MHGFCMTGIEFRKSTLQESDIIATFQILMAKETEGIDLDPEVCKQGVSAVFKDSSKGVYYICKVEDRIVASLLITFEWSDWTNKNVWWIQSVFVEKEFRGRGIYKGLYSYIKGLAIKDNTVRGIRLYVDHNNSKAQQVYLNLKMNNNHYDLFEWMK